MTDLEIREAFKAWFKKEYLGIDILANQGDEGAITRRDYAYVGWKAAKAQAVQEGFVLVSKDKLHEWKCMARRSEELGCPDCYESRGYSHNLAEEIEAQEQTQ